MFDLTGKVALITGSSRGIGKSIALEMAKQGAKVVVSGRKEEVCKETALEINMEVAEAGVQVAVAISCNISHKEQLQHLVDETHRTFGTIDILVCNAAVNPYFGSSATIPDEAFDKVLNANIKSNHWLCNMVLPDMIEKNDGSIIIVSSVGGFKGSSVLGTYSISKAADMQLARNLAVEHGGHNIRANTIAPGLIKTDFSKALWQNPDVLEASLKNSPLKRIGLPEDIGGLAVFLASRAGSFITGQTITVDGGAIIA